MFAFRRYVRVVTSSLRTPSLQDLAASSSLHGSTSAGLSELLQEKDAIILSLQTSMEEGDRDKMRLNEQITDLSRYVGAPFLCE